MNFQTLTQALYDYGVADVLLPFIFLFTIFFATLQKTQIMAKTKPINVTLATVFSLLVVIPHATGTYPPGFDVVTIMNRFIPEVMLLLIAVFSFVVILAAMGIPPRIVFAIQWNAGVLILANFIVYLVYPQLFGIALILSAFLVLFNILFGGKPNMFSTVPMIMLFGVVYLLLRQIAVPQELPLWLSFTQNTGFQFGLMVFLAMVLLLNIIMGTERIDSSKEQQEMFDKVIREMKEITDKKE